MNSDGGDRKDDVSSSDNDNDNSKFQHLDNLLTGILVHYCPLCHINDNITPIITPTR